MTFIRKPKILASLGSRNALGLTKGDYEGTMSTLCAGCGHDSVSAAFVQAFFELDLAPHLATKLSGIGCSSKTPAYFLGGSHGINTVHGRMPAVATGAHGANRQLYTIGVSGDGDTLSIGLGQFAHAMRRNLNMLYVIENNGVYGLTKGQFSASADVGSTAKKGDPNRYRPIDPVVMALTMGASLVGRGFSGDKGQLVPLLKAGIKHRGFALIDVISPCVTFNDHEGSTKSYAYTRGSVKPVVSHDFIPHAEPIELDNPTEIHSVVTMHDGSQVEFQKVGEDYDPTDRIGAIGHVERVKARGAIPTGLLYVDRDAPDMHELGRTVDEPLRDLEFESLCPGKDALDEIQLRYR